MLCWAFAVGWSHASEAPAAKAAAAVSADAFKPKNDYNITINYELGMHCTGFDFTYCCVLPPYNSIQSQVVKTSTGKRKFPELLEADPADAGVLVDGNKRFKLAYGHVNNTFSEGSKLKYWDVPYDVNGNGKYEKNENVANAYFTHLYVYKDLKGTNPKGTSADKEKLFVGIQIPVPRDNGPAGAAVPSPMKGGHLHYTGEKGTMVFTKSPVLDNVPIVLTNPGIWDALGLPLTPFGDREAGQDLLTLTESDIQPFQEAWVSMVDAKTGAPVIDSHSGQPIRFVGTNPIDIPNCANCHSNKTANGDKFTLYKQERDNASDALKDEVTSSLAGQFEGREKELSAAFRSVTKQVVRQRILKDQIRIDGRGLTDIRQLTAEVEVLPRVHGSAIFERGETQIMGVTTLNMLKMEQQIDSLSPVKTKRYMHNYNFPPYSTGETGRVGS
ncbi:MAG: hypothetical protein ACK4ZS_03540, partial [Sulfurimicrobium sp.]